MSTFISIDCPSDSTSSHSFNSPRMLDEASWPKHMYVGTYGYQYLVPGSDYTYTPLVIIVTMGDATFSHNVTKDDQYTIEHRTCDTSRAYGPRVLVGLAHV